MSTSFTVNGFKITIRPENASINSDVTNVTKDSEKLSFDLNNLKLTVAGNDAPIVASNLNKTVFTEEVSTYDHAAATAALMNEPVAEKDICPILQEYAQEAKAHSFYDPVSDEAITTRLRDLLKNFTNQMDANNFNYKRNVVQLSERARLYNVINAKYREHLPTNDATYEEIVDHIAYNKTAPVRGFVEESIKYLNENPELLTDNGYTPESFAEILVNPEHIHIDKIDVYVAMKTGKKPNFANCRYISVGSKFSKILGRLYNEYLSIGKTVPPCNPQLVQKEFNEKSHLGLFDIKAAFHSLSLDHIMSKLIANMIDDDNFDGEVIKSYLRYIRNIKYTMTYKEKNVEIPQHYTTFYPIVPGNSVAIHMFAYATKDISCFYKYVDDISIVATSTDDFLKKEGTLMRELKSLGLTVNNSKRYYLTRDKGELMVFKYCVYSNKYSLVRTWCNIIKDYVYPVSHTYLGEELVYQE